MTTNEIIELAQKSVLSQLPVKANTGTIQMYTYLGVMELYRRFNLLIKAENIFTCEETHLYELRSKNINQVLSIYDQKGKELIPNTIIGSKNYDYKQINYRTFLFTNPKDEYLTFIYKASPKAIVDLDEELDIPPDMSMALLDYIAYRGHSTINKDNMNEADAYYKRFEMDCADLERQGYKVNLNTASLDIRDKGFI
jgi:hypothetical protein